METVRLKQTGAVSFRFLLLLLFALIGGGSLTRANATAPAIAVEEPVGNPLTSGTTTVALHSQAAGAPNAPMTFTIRNAGSTALSLTSVTVKDGDKADFSVDTTNTLASVPAGGSTTFAVTFTLDDQAATRATTLEILSDDPAQGTFDVALTGALGPQIAVEQPAGQALTSGTSTVDYGMVRLNHTSTLTYTIRNTGTTPLTLSGVSVSDNITGDFTVDQTALPASLASNATATFKVTFTPRAPGTETASLHVASSDAMLGDFTAGLTATCPNVPELIITNASGQPVTSGIDDFAGSDVYSAVTTFTYTLKNNGPAPLTFQVANVGGEGTISVESGYATTLNPGASTSLKLDVSPRMATLNTFFANLSTNDPFQPTFNLGIYAIGEEPAGIVVLRTPLTTVPFNFGNINQLRSGDTVDFGAVQAGGQGTQTLYIYNDDLGGLVISSVTVTGSAAPSFTVDKSGIPSNIPVSESSLHDGVLKVTYSPTAVSAGNQATLEIDSNSSVGGKFLLNLTGGSSPEPSLGVEQQAGAALVSGTSTVPFVANLPGINPGVATLPFTIVNHGGADLHIASISLAGGGTSSFSIDTTGTLTTLTPGQSSTFNVTLTLSDHAARPTDTLQIVSDDPTIGTFSVGLTGTVVGYITVAQNGQSPGPAPSPSDFGAVDSGQTGTLTFTISNPGGTTRTVTGVSVSGANAADFSVDGGPFPLSLAPGTETTFSVTFAPSAIGDESATLTIASDDPANGSFQIVLTATGVPLAAPANSVALAAGGDAPGAGGASGLPAHAKLTTFGEPATDDAGDLAYTAGWAVSATEKGTGLFLNDQCLGIIGGEFTPVTGTKFKTFGMPVVDEGVIVLPATLSGVPAAKASVILSGSTSAALEVIAQVGATAPDASGATSMDSPTFKVFRGVSVHKGSILLYAQAVGGKGAAKVTAADDVGLWVKEGAGPLTRVFHEGAEPLSGASVKTLTSFAVGNESPGQGRGWLTTPSHPHVLAYAMFGGGIQGVFDEDNTGAGSLIAQTRRAGFTGPKITGATFSSISVPATNDAGQLTFRAALTLKKNVVTAATDQGIFSRDNTTGSFTPLARLGDTAGSTGAKFSAFKDPVLGEDGGIAFPATLSGSTARGLNATTLWWQTPAGQLELLAQAGPNHHGLTTDLPADAQWASFTSLAIAADHGPIFTGTLTAGKGGVTASTASGAWAVDSAGNIRTLFRTGDTTIIAGKTLTGFNLLKASVGTMGVSRNFNGAQEVVWLATFQDKSQAIITTEVP